MSAVSPKEVEEAINRVNKINKEYINKLENIVLDLQKYEELDQQLQLLTGFNLEKFVEIARMYPMFIGGNGTPIYSLAKAMNKIEEVSKI